jgi:hypothetical protein
MQILVYLPDHHVRAVLPQKGKGLFARWGVPEHLYAPSQEERMLRSPSLNNMVWSSSRMARTAILCLLPY